MRARAAYGLTFLLLLLSVPWPFTGTSAGAALGFPPWAVYSLAVTVVCALVIAALLRHAWDAMAGDDGGDGDG